MRYRRVGARTGGSILSELSGGNIIWHDPLWADPHPGLLFRPTRPSLCLNVSPPEKEAVDG